MKTISIGFALALGLGAPGCKSKGADCDQAINHSMELSKASLSKMPGVDDAMLAKMRDVGVAHCKADTWPAEVLTCMTGAKTEADAQACYGKLTAEQQQKMNSDAMKLAAPSGDSAAAPASGDSAPAPASDDSAPAPASGDSAAE